MNISMIIKYITAGICIIFSANSFSDQTLSEKIASYCTECPAKMSETTGAYILEKGEEALMSRAWLSQNATQTIDIQYFIWSTDNIGILASESLLNAADRGVKIRVIVDDLLIDAEDKTLVALDEHPNIDIKIYNPRNTVGVSAPKQAVNALTDFRGVNQRMHDKVAVFDGVVGVTGGRNMADEYFDYNQEYNFRDRDILLLGKAVSDMEENFDEFWDSKLSVSVGDILKRKKKNIKAEEITDIYNHLHAYANNTSNYEPEIRSSIDNMSIFFPEMVNNIIWTDADFISDIPGKNDNVISLGGGGNTTAILADELSKATQTVFIQSPYLVMPKEGIKILRSLTDKGVKIRICTNSLASTDNLLAFSGYHKQRQQLLDVGVEIYEFMPHPKIQADLIKRYPRLADNNPVFAIHAKSMVIDGSTVFIGTFNLDPRSANLNTEVGVLIHNPDLGKQLESSISRDMLEENSWKITEDFDPDDEVPFSKRFKLLQYKLLPLNSVL